jgi:CheY-like chemotaxis protein
MCGSSTSAKLQMRTYALPRTVARNVLYKVGKVYAKCAAPHRCFMKLILLVEDNKDRAAKIKSLVPGGVRCVWCQSAGAAIGVLRRDRFSCVLLDHDLESDPRVSLNGQAVAKMVCETQSQASCSIFVHSQNSVGAAAMVNILRQARFSTTSCPWSEADAAVMREWLTENLVDD